MPRTSASMREVRDSGREASASGAAVRVAISSFAPSVAPPVMDAMSTGTWPIAPPRIGGWGDRRFRGKLLPKASDARNWQAAHAQATQQADTQGVLQNGLQPCVTAAIQQPQEMLPLPVEPLAGETLPRHW